MSYTLHAQEPDRGPDAFGTKRFASVRGALETARAGFCVQVYELLGWKSSLIAAEVYTVDASARPTYGGSRRFAAEIPLPGEAADQRDPQAGGCRPLLQSRENRGGHIVKAQPAPHRM